MIFLTLSDSYSPTTYKGPITRVHVLYPLYLHREHFSVKLKPEGTPFQRRVWQALNTIPYGKTVSYGEIAKAIGKPTASRAVGAANGKNPLSIIVPCHRVIGGTGKLVGYGGGLGMKKTLLTLEGWKATTR